MSIVLLVLCIVLCIGLIIHQRTVSKAVFEYEDDSPKVLHRRLVRSIQGHSDKDKPILNRLLALGVPVVPAVIEELNVIRDTTDVRNAARVHALEDLLIDFGLAVVPDLIHTLRDPMVDAHIRPSLYRVLSGLGDTGITSYLDQSQTLSQRPEDYLRCARQLSPESMERFVKNVSAEKIEKTFSMLAPLWSDSPARLAHVVHKLDDAQLEAYLLWVRDWPTFCHPEDILRGLYSRHEGSRIAAARVSRVFIDARFPKALRTLLKGDVAERRSAAMALISQDAATSKPHLERCLEDMDPFVSSYGLIGLTRTPMARLEPRWLAAHPRVAQMLRLKANVPMYELDIQPLLDTLNYDDRPSGPLAIHLLGLMSPRHPIARERLIRLAEEGPQNEDRIWAVWALARVGDRTVPDLLIRTIRHVPIGDHYGLLRDAAEHLGPDIITPLLRRFSAQSPARARKVLSLIRGVSYQQSVHQLLHVLDDLREPSVAQALMDTLWVGGPDVHNEIIDVFVQRTPGVLLPALKYLSVHGQRSDIIPLLDGYFDTVSRRSLILNIIECLGEEICPDIELRLAEGGGDDALLHLEFRYALLRSSREKTHDFAQGVH